MAEDAGVGANRHGLAALSGSSRLRHMECHINTPERNDDRRARMAEKLWIVAALPWAWS